MIQLDSDFDDFISIIWQGNGTNASPGYAERGVLYDNYPGPTLPYSQVGGIYSFVGLPNDPYAAFHSKYELTLETGSPLELNSTLRFLSTSELKVTLDMEVTDEITSTNNKLFFLVTKYTNTNYSTSVIYKSDNYDLNLSDIGSRETVEHIIPIDASWNISDLKVVTMIQSYDDLTLIQADQTEFLNMIPPIPNNYIDFGEVTLNESVTFPVTIQSNSDFEFSGSGFGVDAFTVEETFLVEPFGETTVDVTFTPTELREYSEDVIYFTNDPIFGVLTIGVHGVGVAVPNQDVNTEIPSVKLKSSYPNPFQPGNSTRKSGTIISYEIDSKNTENKLSIYNIQGKVVKTFNNLPLENGHGSVSWNGDSNDGSEVSSGIYFYRIEGKVNSGMKKIVLIR